MTIQSIQRAAAVLRSFSEIRPELGVTELAAIHNVHKSTISRILTTLESEGMVSQNPETGKYRLGIGLVGLAGVALGRISVRGAAQPIMSQLVHDIQETSILMVRDGREAVTVEWFGSTQALRYVGWIGRRVPLFCTAGGRILLAWQPFEKQVALMPFLPQKYTKSTVVDPQTLQNLLAEVKETQIAVVREEFEEGFSSLGAPIRDRHGRVTAALTIAVPSVRLTAENSPSLQEELRVASQNISAELGYGFGG